ncbi:nucleoporin p58/p45-like isoform X2 [Branchiostoma lanceolatum]|uniref:nucleoporin p58/p45-like isoform X2 n=1 Tax=Branchiostoma lanceolatum TaxID=7740 RepID=UPI0034550190
MPPTGGFTFGQTQTPAQPQGSLFAMPAPATAPAVGGLSFGTPATTTSSLTSTGSIGGLTFGQAAPVTGLGVGNTTPATGLSFGTPSTKTGTTGFTLGQAAAAATTGTPGFNLGLPTAAATTTSNFVLTLPTAATTTASIFGTPAATTAAATTGGLFGTPATSTPALTGGIFGNKTTAAATAATTTATGLAGGLFGAAPATTGGLKLGGLGGAATTTATGTGLGGGFSFGAPTATTTTTSAGGLTLGGLTGLAAPATTTASIGLGGTGPTSQASTTTTGTVGTKPGDGKAGKDNEVPNEIGQSVETFRKYVKEQKDVQDEISRVSSKPLDKVQEDITALRQMLSVVSSGLQRNAVAIEKLKADSAQELKNVEIAQRTKDTPPGLQHEHTAPAEYFQRLVEQFEVQMLMCRQQIEQLENHIAALSHPAYFTPQTLSSVLRRLHETFVALAGNLHGIHEAVKTQKEQYLVYRKVFLGDTSDVFEARRKSQSASTRSKPPPVTVGPSPFTGMTNAAAVAMATALNAQQQPTAGAPPTLGLNTTGIGGLGTTGAFGAGATGLGTTGLGTTGLGTTGLGTTGLTATAFGTGTTGFGTGTGTTSFGTTAPQFGTPFGATATTKPATGFGSGSLSAGIGTATSTFGFGNQTTKPMGFGAPSQSTAFSGLKS